MEERADRLLLVVLKVKTERENYKKVVLVRRREDRDTQVAYREVFSSTLSSRPVHAIIFESLINQAGLLETGAKIDLRSAKWFFHTEMIRELNVH